MENNVERHELKEAIETIAGLARKPLEEAQEVHATYIYGRPYCYNRNSHRPELIVPPKFEVPGKCSISSLDGLIEIIRQEGVKVQLPAPFASCYNDDLDKSDNNYFPHLFVEVDSYRGVEVYTDNLNFDRNHYTLYETSASMESFRPGRDYGHEEMMIALRSMFQPTEDRDYLLELLGSVTNEAKVTSTDNGLNQQVTVNKGIANIQRERIRSIVRLKPYRTFPELEQPESEFLVRLSADEEGHIRVALHEADGGMWKLTARRIIAGYLKEALSQEIADGKVTVIG